MLKDSHLEIKGLDEALRKLHAMPENVKTFVGRGLYVEAERVMTDSKKNYVPVDTGVLRSSGFVKLPTVTADEISVTLGFGGPAGTGNQGETNKKDCGYAFIVHENPRAGKTGGLPPSSSPGAIVARTFGTGRYQRKHYAQVGQWKYLEIPLLAAQPKIKAVIAGAVGEAFEKG